MNVTLVLLVLWGMATLVFVAYKLANTGLLEALANRRGLGQGAFYSALVDFLIHILRFEGNLSRQNLELTGGLLRKMFGIPDGPDTFSTLKSRLIQKRPIDPFGKLPASTSNKSRLQLLHLLYQVAAFKGCIRLRELAELDQIARQLGINTAGRKLIREQFRTFAEADPNQRSTPPATYTLTGTECYKRLGISPQAGDAEIRATFRRLAKIWHPDRNTGRSAAEQQTAKETFQQILNAYMIIKRMRGMN